MPTNERSPKPGWVYILSNAALARNILKIGLTQVDCMSRMRAVAVSHRIPGEWKLEFSQPVRDVFQAELAVHRTLGARRLRWEFFRLPLDTAKAEVRRLVRPWRCTEVEVLTPPTKRGATYVVEDRATKASAAARKAVQSRKRRAAARKAVATRIARKRAAEAELPVAAATP